MTQDERNTLLVDLCARLLYDVQGITSEGVVSPLLTRGEADWDILTSLNYRIVKHGWKPFLRSMSSMTDEEREEYRKFSYYGAAGVRPYSHNDFVAVPSFEKMDWLHEHHFDYRGLIEKGLALEAPKDMYNTKTE